MTREPRWLTLQFLLAVHEAMLAEHGGARGIRDTASLETALFAPRHRWEHGETRLQVLAAVLAESLIRNHPFTDGNKRVAFLAMAVFLARNGLRLTAPEPEAAAVMWSVAAGDTAVDALASWLGDRSEPSP